MQPFSYQHGEQYNSKRHYEKTVVILCLYTYLSGLELQRCSLELLLPLLKYISGISEWGLANSFRNHVIHSLFRVMNFHDIYSQQWKVKTFFTEDRISVDSVNAILRLWEYVSWKFITQNEIWIAWSQQWKVKTFLTEDSIWFDSVNTILQQAPLSVSLKSLGFLSSLLFGLYFSFSRYLHVTSLCKYVLYYISLQLVFSLLLWSIPSPYFCTAKQSCESVKFLYGSWSADPYHWLADSNPDPAFFVSGGQIANKK